MKVKCRYSNCKHESRELQKEDAVLSGRTTYYHKDCYEEMSLIKEIIDVYCNKVESDPVFTHLSKTVKDLVVNKGVDPHYLLFALNYAADNNFIHHIPGLRYIAKDEEIWKEYQKRITKQYIESEKQKQKQYIENKNRTFTYVNPKQKSVANLFE